MQTQNFTEEQLEVEGIPIRRTVYQIGDTFYCHIYNADPGATIARASNVDRQAATDEAMEKNKKKDFTKYKENLTTS